VRAIHGELLAEHGGTAGIRDGSQFGAALAPPQDQAEYEGRDDIGTLAAAYAFAIARERHFAAGNRRTALAAAALFLELNGYRLTATDGDCVVTMLGVADGTFSAKDLVDWFQANIDDI
jgi:death-on-curing protein